ncbi:hypothetical protein JXJ21_12685 [candidate division KSB1 bacterium]|nr:hypothetical protein [candidate division KSB1 bacterium]
MANDSSDIINEITGNNQPQGAVHHSLDDYFLDELQNHLNFLHSILTDKAESNFAPSDLQQMIHAAQRIEDLAMVHGYHEIEAYANVVFAQIVSLKNKSSSNHADKLKLIQAIFHSIKKIRAIEPTIDGGERPPANDSGTVALSKKHINDILPAEKSLDESPSEANKHSATELFDIKEVDDLLKLKSKSNPLQPRNQENPDTPQTLQVVEVDWAATARHAAPAFTTEQVASDSDFAGDQFQAVEESMEALLEVFSASHEIENIDYAIQNIQQAFATLQDLMQRSASNDMQNLSNLVAKICHNNLSSEIFRKPGIAVLFKEIIDIFKAYLNDETESSDRIKHVVLELVDIFKSNSQSEKPGISETLAPDDDEILEKKAVSPSPKKRIKLIPSKEDVRRRWILKF